MNPRVTLDTNCIIDLEPATDRAVAVQGLIALHDSARIRLSIPAIMASERQVGGRDFSSYDEFTDRLSKAGIGHLPHLEPMAYYDVSFFDHALLCDETMAELELSIHEILHSGSQFEYEDYCQKHKFHPESRPPTPRWRNAKCDVQVAWTHIHHKGNVLVTNDETFLKVSKLPQLIAIGAGAITRPKEALALLAAF